MSIPVEAGLLVVGSIVRLELRGVSGKVKARTVSGLVHAWDPESASMVIVSVRPLPLAASIVRATHDQVTTCRFCFVFVSIAVT